MRRILALALVLLLAPTTAFSAVVGNRHLHVVIVAWEGTTPQFPDAAARAARVVAEVSGWTAVSSGRVTFTGQGWGPYFVPKLDSSNTALVLERAIADVRTLAVASGDYWATHNPGGSWFISFQVPAGLGNSRSGYGGYVSVGGAANMHEMGHVFGFSHARAMSFDVLNPSGALQRIEYGNVSDVMGSGGGGLTNVGNKRIAGWVDAADGIGPRTLAVPASGTYTIARSDGPSGTVPIALRLQTTPNIAVEYRAGHVFVYLGSFTPSWSPWVAEDLDPLGPMDYHLDVGQVYENAAAKVRITTVAKSTADAVIDVELNVASDPHPAGVATVERVK